MNFLAFKDDPDLDKIVIKNVRYKKYKKAVKENEELGEYLFSEEAALSMKEALENSMKK